MAEPHKQRFPTWKLSTVIDGPAHEVGTEVEVRLLARVTVAARPGINSGRLSVFDFAGPTVWDHEKPDPLTHDDIEAAMIAMFESMQDGDFEPILEEAQKFAAGFTLPDRPKGDISRAHVEELEAALRELLPHISEHVPVAAVPSSRLSELERLLERGGGLGDG